MKIGIAGSGKIVPDFLEAAKALNSMEKADTLEISGIFCTPRSLEKTQTLAAEWNIPQVVTDFNDLLSLCQAVYIALPNHLHFEYAKKALLAGKSVICEKPFCANAEQLKELADIAREKGLFLFEAISNQYFPNYEKVKELLPELGKVRAAALNYSQHSSRYDDFTKGIVHPVFDPDKNGGALMDLNVYNIHFITGLFGKPSSIHYSADLERGVDVAGVLVLTYPGMVASLMAAKNVNGPSGIVLEGEKGMILSSDPANVFASFTFDGTKYALNERPERLFDELRAFVSMVNTHDLQLNEKRIEHSILVQEILDEARHQIYD